MKNCGGASLPSNTLLSLAGKIFLRRVAHISFILPPPPALMGVVSVRGLGGGESICKAVKSSLRYFGKHYRVQVVIFRAQELLGRLLLLFSSFSNLKCPDLEFHSVLNRLNWARFLCDIKGLTCPWLSSG